MVNGEKEGEEKSTVTSDYAAIMPMIQGFKAIAYTDDSKIVTKNTCKPELYKTAKEAIENVYTVPAQYRFTVYPSCRKLWRENYCNHSQKHESC